jgi:cobalamin biosynthetic protein CobC
LAKRSGLLIVDEAFADVVPSKSLAPHLDKVPAVVLRSFGKFFGLAGLRLGFVAGAAAVVGRLERLLGDWPVSAAAIAIAGAALADRAWQEETRARLSRDARALSGCLDRHGLAIRGGTDLFALVENPSASDIHIGLAEGGVWTRSFQERRDWLRLGIPSPSALERFDRVLAGVVKSLTAR